MKTAYSYVRFSSRKQAKGDSLRRQTAEKRTTLCDQHGWLLDGSTYQDLGVSAFRGKNRTTGNLALFLAAIESGKVKPGSILIVESLDRLSRDDVDEALKMFLAIIQAGVSIATLDPERIYDRAAIKNPVALLEPLFIFARANEESARKSTLSVEAWSQRRKKLDTEKATAKCPSWLELSLDRKTFVPIPEKVAVVKRMFQLANDGVSTDTMERRFNAEGVPPISTRKDSRNWWKSTILTTLRNRAVLGEFQPCSGGKPVGTPIKGYYGKPIIPEELFYSVQSVLDSHKGLRGRKGNEVTNLFAGRVYAEDGFKITIVAKSTDHPARIVSSGARRGIKGSKYASFPYLVFERAMLLMLAEVKAKEILEKRDDANELEGEEAAIANLDERIEKIKARIATDPNLDTLLDMVSTLQGERKQRAANFERLKATTHADSNREQLAGIRQLLDKMDNTTGTERSELRGQLRTKLRFLIERIDTAVEVREDRKRACNVAVKFRGNGLQRFSVVYWPGGWMVER